MKTVQILGIIALTLSFTLSSCSKTIEEPGTPIPVDTYTPTIPDGSRIIIHFGTSTMNGCMYSFSNCIWIGWGATNYNSRDHLALQFDQGDVAGQYFGQYFPLTADYTVDAATAQALGVQEGIIPAGFYPLLNATTTGDNGKLQVVFDPASALKAGNLFNPVNPQDNVGQLHNLAVQVILNDNRNEIKALKQDRKALQKFLMDKAAQFLAEAGLPVSPDELKGADALDLDRDFSDYAARLNESRLSANDKELLLPVFDKAVAIPVRSPEDLAKFVTFMTEQENRLTSTAKMDNPKVVLSMLSILKNSRYFWYWNSITRPTDDGTINNPERIPVWLADAIGAEFGGLIGAIVASALASEK